MNARSVLFVSGRSPLEERNGGHCAYVRAHAYAAQAAGYEVHLFALSHHRVDSVQQAYGTVHHARVEKTPIRQRYIRTLAPSLADLMLSREDIWHQADCVHGFGLWSEAGTHFVQAVSPHKSLRHILSLYTVYQIKAMAHLKAVDRLFSSMCPKKLLEVLHVTFSAARLEAGNYRQADQVPANYESVRQMVTQAFGLHSKTPHPRSHGGIDLDGPRLKLNPGSPYSPPPGL